MCDRQKGKKNIIYNLGILWFISKLTCLLELVKNQSNEYNIVFEFSLLLKCCKNLVTNIISDILDWGFWTFFSLVLYGNGAEEKFL